MTPSLALIYGPSKCGKTTDAIATFPRGKFIARENALKSSSVLGIDIKPGQIGTANNLVEVRDAIEAAGNVKDRTGRCAFDAVVVDDLSIIVDRTVLDIQSGFKNKMRMWGVIRDQFVALRVAAENVGLHVVFTCHDKAPLYYGPEDKEVEAKTATVGTLKSRGGPQLPGRMPEGMPAICDHVLRAEKQRADSPLLFPGYWPTVVRMNTEEPWIDGDREDVAYDGAPLNLRELIREAARRRSGDARNAGVRRWPGLEWQDEAVEHLAPVFLKGLAKSSMDWNAGITFAEDEVRRRWKPANDRHVRWAVRDALACAQFRHHATLPFLRYGTGPTGLGGVFT